MKNLFGWDSPPRTIAEKYIDKCLFLSESDSAFSNFRRDEDYTKVLEGGQRIVGENHLKYIRENHGIDAIKENLVEFKENDLYGNPVIMEFQDIGKICPCTILYISHALDIKKMMDSFSPKRIVEIGGGFGALCKTLSVFYNFDEYVLIDFPEALSLCRKYLEKFPKIKNKITYIPCDNPEKYQKIGEVDLFIAIASLAECSFDVQMSYIDIMMNSVFGFIIYNTNHIPGKKEGMDMILEKTVSVFDRKIDQHIDAAERIQFFRR